MKEKVAISGTVRREPGQLKTGGAGTFEHGSGAPHAKCSLRRIIRVKDFKARIYIRVNRVGTAHTAPLRFEGALFMQTEQ